MAFKYVVNGDAGRLQYCGACARVPHGWWGQLEAMTRGNVKSELTLLSLRPRLDTIPASDRVN